MLKNNLRVGPCDALSERVWGGEDWGYVVEEGLLCSCETAESGNEVARQVDTGRCVVTGGD